MMNEGVHFDLSYTSAYSLGFKLISVNVSDIYAMGGRPFGVLLTLAFTQETSEDFFMDLYEGIQRGLDLYGIDLLGGDLCSSLKHTTLSATVLGVANNPVYRKGAREGDLIFLTGTLGDSSLGLELLRAMDESSRLRLLASKDLKGISNKSVTLLNPQEGSSITIDLADILIPLTRHLMPVARDSQKLTSVATSMIDVSDGLFIDLSRLCEEGNVGARIYESRLPISDNLLGASALLKIDPITLASKGGEDYELLFTIPADVPLPDLGNLKVTPIGEITSGERIFIDKHGVASEIKAAGYEHFKA